MNLTQSERMTLDTLAARVAEIAALPEQQTRINRWKALNALKPVRPMVAIDQICWHELMDDPLLQPVCTDPFARGVEWMLRETLYRWEHLRADMVVRPELCIGRAVHGMSFGLSPIEQTAVTDPANGVVGHYYLDQLSTESDLAKLQEPCVHEDVEASQRAYEMAQQCVGRHLNVRIQGVQTMFAPWDRIPELHSVEQTILDLIDRPEFAHALIQRMLHLNLIMLDQLESQGLLGSDFSVIHCSGAFTDELPQDGFDPICPRAIDNWTCGMAQIFSTVSPAMHDEFEIQYALQWYRRFGLTYYGCCEPLDRKIDIIRQIPNVRKVSISPWADVQRSAQSLGVTLVMSRKPNPALLAGPVWHPELVERELRETLDACAESGTPLEFILKDISTLCYEPRRLWEWHDLAMRLVEDAAETL